MEESTQVCRLCLNQNSLEDVFSSDRLHVMILEFLTIDIKSEDNMSQQICSDCLQKLFAFNDFKISCLNVQDRLQAQTSTSSKEAIPPAPDHDEISVELEVSTCEPDDSKEHETAIKSKRANLHQAIVTSKSGRKRYIYDQKESYKNQLIACDICGKLVAKVRLEGHRNVHNGLKPFHCERGCDEVRFHCKQLRAHHYRNVHDGEQRECELCRKTYRSRRSLAYHRKDVHSAKTVICAMCSQAFASNARLNQHMKFHNGTRDHPCGLCNYSFYSNHDLVKHSRTHQ